MDEIWINYCGMPVCFGLQEFAIVTGLRCHRPEVPLPNKRSKERKCKGKIDGLFNIARRGYKASNLLTDLEDKTIPEQYGEKLCLVWFAHSVILARDVNKVIEDGLLARAEDFDKFNNHPWGYDSFYLTVQYLLTKLSSGTTILYGFPCAFMAWAFEAIPPIQKQLMNYPDEVYHPRMFRWLAAKSNTNIKEADLFNPLDDAVVHPWIVPTKEESVMTSYITLGHVNTIADPTVELIKKKLAGATAIRRAVRQSQPNVEALHDQPFTKADPGASSGGVVSVGGGHADAATTRDDDLQYVDIILCLMRKRQLTYREVYDTVDRIMDLDFCKKLKDRYNQLNVEASALGVGLDFLVPTLVLDEEEMLRYVRGDRPNPHGKSWTEVKRILTVISVNGMHYRAVKILLEEGKINVYDSNVPLIDDFDLFLLVEPLMVLLPILLRESNLMNHLPKEVLMKKSWDFDGQNRGMILPKDVAAKASSLHALAHIECLLTGTEMSEPTTFMCKNAVANLQEVWAYGVLTGRLKPVYVEEPVK
ncbi:hypothetical protein P3S67_023989 [Capsicum chacoense]